MKTCSPENISSHGSVYIHATDTCYGFAAPFYDEKALRLIQDLKGRSAKKPISLLFSDMNMLKKYCELSQEQEFFITQQTLPSSFLLKKKDLLQEYFPEQENVSVRIENVFFPVRMSSLLGGPVTSTSVNKSSEPELYNSDEVQKYFSDAPDDLIFIDSGNIEKTPPSNIWDLTKKPYKRIR